jgi:PST family polysaccharide transporter
VTAPQHEAAEPPEAAGAVARKAVRGAAWSMAAGMLTRVLQTVGTLVLANLLGTVIAGEVATASVLALSATSLTLLGVPHYLITRKIDREAAWHASVVMIVTGAAALLVVLASSARAAEVFGAPDLPRFLPGLALSAMLSRVAVVPERLLQFQLRFRTVSAARTVGELTYLGASVPLVLLGAGGQAIVWANIGRSLVLLVLLTRACPVAEWLTPHRISWSKIREMLAFGVPVGLAVILGFGARWWDNLLVGRLFGAAVVGMYNQAYNLADIPATQVGEQVGDVLTPSLAQVDDEQKKRMLVRSTGVLGLLVFPMAAGLGAVAETLVATLLRPEWAMAAPMLTILCALSVVRPIGWTIGSYLQATNHTRAVLWLSILRLACVFAGIGVLGHFFGPVVACYGVGLGFGVYAAGAVLAASRVAEIPVAVFVKSMGPPLLACVPLVGAVLLARAGSQALGLRVKGVGLAIEIVAGAAVYVAAALVLARSASRELLSLVKGLRARRSGSGTVP